MRNTKSYTLNGKVSCDLSDWLNWLDISDEIFAVLHLKPTECGILSKKGTNIKSLKNLRKKLVTLYEKGDVINGLTILTLQPEYSSCGFDFTITLTRNGAHTPYITLILNYQYYNADSIDNEDRIIELLKAGIDNAKGEIYEMDIEECPEFYAAKANPKSFYKTLKVIKKI